MYLDLQQNLEGEDNMAMYYEVGLSIGGIESITSVDTNFVPAKDWRAAVEYVMSVSKETYQSHDVEFEFVKEYRIEDEPKDLGYVFNVDGKWEL